MASLITSLRERIQPSVSKVRVESPSSLTEKDVYTTEVAENDTSSLSDIPKDAQAGELTLDETASGGLGRHLGVFSTTFLMYFSAFNQARNFCLLLS